MKKILELILWLTLVCVPTYIVYTILTAGIPEFWDAQFFWSIALAIGWVIVASGYYNQGWLVRKEKSAENVSIVLPIAVFSIQCILFIKGVYYKDWSLLWGAMVVNSGVLFSLYQISKARGIFNKILKK